MQARILLNATCLGSDGRYDMIGENDAKTVPSTAEAATETECVFFALLLDLVREESLDDVCPEGEFAEPPPPPIRGTPWEGWWSDRVG